MSRLSSEARTQSKRVALLAVFASMVVALEVFPLPPFTDIKVYPAGIPFTVDWTGIPIIVVLLGLGTSDAFFVVGAMAVAIAYRNVPGAVFKTVAEALTVLGVAAARLATSGHRLGPRGELLSYTVAAMLSRGVGMFFANIVLLPVFYPVFYTPETALAASLVLVPWNFLQAAINVFGGVLLFRAVPSSLAMQAELVPPGGGPTDSGGETVPDGD